MNKNTVEYINGSKNVTKDEFVLGRECTGNKELVFVSLPESKKPMYALWNSRKTARKYKKVESKEEIKFEKIPPKGTGGQASYAMLMLKEIQKINNASIEARGAILSFTTCLEWNTGRLFRVRDGKSLTREMIAEHLRIDMSKLRLILKELIGLKIIQYDSKKQAYFIDKNIIRKGV